MQVLYRTALEVTPHKVLFAVDDPKGLVFHAVTVRIGEPVALGHPYSEAIEWVVGNEIMTLPAG